VTDICPPCADALRAALRAEASALLDQAERNARMGHRGNRDWCYRAAFGALRACGMVRRIVEGRA
jgi:hypothetical protein